MPCIMPEMPYCPACKFGRVVYPADVETFYDTYGGECEWVCTCKDGGAKMDATDYCKDKAFIIKQWSRRVTDENA